MLLDCSFPIVPLHTSLSSESLPSSTKVILISSKTNDLKIPKECNWGEGIWSSNEATAWDNCLPCQSVWLESGLPSPSQPHSQGILGSRGAGSSSLILATHVEDLDWVPSSYFCPSWPWLLWAFRKYTSRQKTSIFLPFKYILLKTFLKKNTSSNKNKTVLR